MSAPAVLVPFEGLVLPWLLPLLRAIVLVAPLLFVIDEEALATRAGVALVWAVLYQRWAFRDRVEPAPDIVGDCVVVAQAALFLLVLVRQPSPFLLPLVALVGLLFLLHLFRTLPSPSPKPDPPQWRPSPLVRGCLTLLMGAHGFVLPLLVDMDRGAGENGGLVSVPNLLWALSAGTAVLLASRLFPLRVLGQWLALQLAMAPHVHGQSALALWAHLLLLGLCFVLLVSSLRPATARSVPVLSALVTLVRSAVEAVVGVLREPLPYQLGVLFAFALLVGGLADDWHTSHVTFPPELVRICDFWLDVADEIRPFYEITSDGYVQQILLPALTEIGQVRLLIKRILESAAPILFAGSKGVSFTFSMRGDVAAVLSFIAGPCLAVVAVLASVFPRGAAFARAPLYWLVVTLGCSVFFLFTQFTSGATVTVVRVLFVDSRFTRTYTAAGRLAYVGSLLMLACSLALVFATGARRLQRQKALATTLPARAPLGARLGLAAAAPRGGAYTPVHQQASAPAPVPARPSCWRRFWAAVGAQMTAPVLLLAAALLVFSLALGTRTSPITSFALVANKKPSFDWLVSTPLDKLSPLASTIEAFLVKAIGVSGPMARLYLLLFAGSRVALQELNCLPCLCVDLDMVGDFFGDLGDKLNPGNWFRRRRRLLNFVDELLREQQRRQTSPFSSNTNTSIPFPSSSFFANGSAPHSSAQGRALLQLEEYLNAGALCTPSHSSCDGLKICVSDVVKVVLSMTELVTKLLFEGLDKATGLLVDLFKRVIPTFDKLAKAFARIATLPSLPDFDLYDFGSIGALPPLGQFLPDWSPPTLVDLPAVPSWSALLLGFAVVLSLLLVSGQAAAALGLLTRAAVTLALTQALALLLLVYVIMDRLVYEIDKTFDFSLVLGWDRTVLQLYALSALLLVVAAFLYIMQSFVPDDTAEEQAMAASKGGGSLLLLPAPTQTRARLRERSASVPRVR